jgi:PKD repeat protein
MAGRRPIVLGIILAVTLSLFLSAPLYASPSRDDDCLSCHTGNGITINSNATGSLKANASSFFNIQVIAEGNGESLTIKWPSSLNPSFTFLPSTVADNGPNDGNPAANKVNATFKVNTPFNSGEYSIRVLAADATFNGASLSFQVHVTKTGPIGPGWGNVSPTAYFLYNRLGMTVKFEDRSWDLDGNITSWRWSFGDNINSTEQNPAHTFAEAGTYATTLTVIDDEGNSSTHSQVFTLPPKNERLIFWGAQILIGSLMIVFTSVFAVGIVSARFKRGGRNG